MSTALYSALAIDEKRNNENSQIDSMKSEKVCHKTSSSMTKFEYDDGSVENLYEKDAENKEHIIWKDVLLIGFAYFAFRLCYFSYIFNLGTLFDTKLASTTLATSFGAETLTSLFVPTLVIRNFGCKRVIVLVGMTTLLFGIAEFYPTYWTFIPCGAIIGVGYSCLWVSLATYLTNIATVYVKLTSLTLHVILGFFFGVVCFMGGIGGVLGNLVTYEILEYSQQEMNSTYFHLTSNDTLSCGANYCQQQHPFTNATATDALQLRDNSSFTKLQSRNRLTLFVTYIVLGLLGPVCVGFFLNRRQNLEDSMRTPGVSVFNQVTATISAMKNVNLLMLSVSCFMAGVTFSFASGSFAQAYVHCAIGSQFISMVAVIHLLSYSAFSFASGVLVKYIGIIGVMLLMNFATEVIYYLMLHWTPDNNGYFIASGYSAWMGAFVGTYTNLLNTLCGVILDGNREATFAFYRVFHSLGAMVGFVTANLVCVSTVIVTFMFLIPIGTGMYLITECRLRMQKNICEEENQHILQ